MVKYKSISELDTFIFHDAVLERLSFEENCMIWDVKRLGVSIANTQNVNLSDMMIKEARVTLHDLEFIPFFHPNTGLLPAMTKEELARFFNAGETWFSYFLSAPSDVPDRLYGDVEWMHTQYVDDYCLISFSIAYTKLVVEWDDFGGPAWWIRSQ
jgi:hypothetical protein